MITFCLVHGAWHDDACWEPLVGELARRGHQWVTPVLALERADASFDDYAQVVIDSLEGRDAAVLVGHSMSSAVIPLVAIKRPVRLLVYLCPAMGGFRRASGRAPLPAPRVRAPAHGRREPQLVAPRAGRQPAIRPRRPRARQG